MGACVAVQQDRNTSITRMACFDLYIYASSSTALTLTMDGCRAKLAVLNLSVGCQEEYGPFTEDDIVRLAPADEEREVLTRQLIAKREEERLAKKASKASKKSARREKEKSASSASAAMTSSSSNPKPSGRVDDDGRKPGAAAAPAEEDGAGSCGGGGGEKKRSKRRKRAAEKDAAVAAAVAANGASAGPTSAKLADAAAEAVKKNKEDSKVYASLFGKKGVSNEHLFIATAGHRYNLG